MNKNMFSSVIKKISFFMTDIISQNKSLSSCVIINKTYSADEKITYFKFDVLGVNLSLKLKACEIVKNIDLLNRFCSNDKNEIVFYSGLCLYRVSDITLLDDGDWLITIVASFNNNSYVKKFKSDELLANYLLFNKLTIKDKMTINELTQDKKVININYYR